MKDGKPDGGHISDARRIVKALRTPAQAGGFGVPTSKIAVVLNRTTEDQMQGVVNRGDLADIPLAGRIDSIGLIEKGWVGGMDAGPDANNLILQAGAILQQISPREDLARMLAEWQAQLAPEPVPEKRRGLLGRLTKQR
jgi:hypothetical protein